MWRIGVISEDVKNLALSAAEYFRIGMEAQGGELLIRFIDCISKDISIKNTDMPKLNYYLNEILSAQSRKDNLYVADILQYELVKIL